MLDHHTAVQAQLLVTGKQCVSPGSGSLPFTCYLVINPCAHVIEINTIALFTKQTERGQVPSLLFPTESKLLDILKGNP